MKLPPGTRTSLYHSAGLDAVLDRMARQAAGLLRGNGPLAVVGVLRRGAPLADRLTERLVLQHGVPPPLRLDLAVKRYADDLTLVYPDTQLTEAPRDASLDLGGVTVLVVDDVLYTGQSLLKVLDHLNRKHAAAVRVAVLVDRCVTTLPLRADVVGLRLEVAPSHIVECHVPPYEPDFSIQLLQPQPAG
ncbi:MAG: phosphoribosyltransferase [Hydrogenophaga sp.]|uniref:phosphoribosyltransferase family protein n=1 Tax=Hydrogenophaga sp. TaxID=1904254 RepID=UPI001BBC839E|nr:phosphoribosyltransferase family protein [Hydrogenophaga sp.]MBS3910924.1 phosphoribosyltransferase [Hydrogenophaga sp.]MDO9149710.1 phosphoribosyltransferase family protein [Hydrogenophaga sp.]MDO9603543.1 phosphoribosyltransferase family protein [Hydrogenophaga sp.]